MEYGRFFVCVLFVYGDTNIEVFSPEDLREITPVLAISASRVMIASRGPAINHAVQPENGHF